MEPRTVARLTAVLALAIGVASCGDDPIATTQTSASRPTGIATTTAPTTITTSSTQAPIPTTAATSTTSSTTTSTSTSAAVPTTAAFTTNAPTTAPTTSAPLPVGLGNWPAPSLAVESLGDLPALLPASPIAGADDAVRFEQDLDGAPIDYVQVFVADDGSRLLQITTNIFQVDSTPRERRDHVEIEPWDAAFFTRSAPGFANLTLGGPGGYIQLNGRNMSRDEALAAARSMQRRAGARAGWDVEELPATMSLLHEGWLGDYTVREIDWTYDGELLAELSIWSGNPTAMQSVASLSGPFTTVDIDGHRAVASERSVPVGDPISLLAWSPSTDVVIYLGMRAPLVDVVEVARTLQPVDLATWNAAARPAPPSFDGCQSFLC